MNTEHDESLFIERHLLVLDVRDNSHSPASDDGKLKYSFTVNLESPHSEIPHEYHKYNPRREDIKI